MRKLIMLLLLFLAISSARADNSITITFVSPTANQVMNNVLNIEVSVASTFSLNAVTASVQSLQTTLTYDNVYLTFKGGINISSLPMGTPLVVTVTATDVFNTQQSASQNFFFVPPPTVTMDAPGQYTESYTGIHIKGHASSIDTCTLWVLVEFTNYDTVFYKNFTDIVDTTISISPLQPGLGSVSIVAVDRWGQGVYVSRSVIYNNSIYLSEIFRSDNQILDYNYHKVLTKPVNQNNNATGVGILNDLNTNTATAIPAPFIPQGNYTTGFFVTPYGAVAPFQEWNNGAVYTGTYVTVAGEYGLVQANGNNNVRELATQITTVLPVPEGGNDPWRNMSMGPSRLVGWIVGLTGTLYQVKNGIITQASATGTGNVSVYYLQVDSNYMVYYKTAGDEYYAYLYDGTNEIQLGHLGDASQNFSPNDPPGAKYILTRNKYTAFCKRDAGGQLQVWLRDSSGTLSQRSFFGTSSYILEMNPNGDVMYVNQGKKYLAKRGVMQIPVDYGPEFLYPVQKTIYRDSAWFVIIGTNLYRLLVDAFVSINNGNWNDPNTWKDGIVPPPNADVIILNAVIVNVNVTCNTLNVHAPGSVTVLPGINLTVLH